MRRVADTWAVVLAGGNGSRLARLTTRQGEIIPKQFCSLGRKHCLLEDTLERARAVAPLRHISSVVALRHRRWWSEPLSAIPMQNVFIEPSNRGTAYGILLALLQIEARCSNPVVVVLPADHYLADESVIARSLRVAASLASRSPGRVYLLGAEPEGPDPGLGYIVPARRRRNIPTGVIRFVEKPSVERAQRLLGEGALWNTFILTGSLRGLLSLFDARFGAVVGRMQYALAADRASDGHAALDGFYEELPPMDFSHEVLERQTHLLEVLRLPPCGWTDLGTPKRVEATIEKLRHSALSSRAPDDEALYFDLASSNRLPWKIARLAP
jgi:mannose-1-phosphate guanylyltransferase